MIASTSRVRILFLAVCFASLAPFASAQGDDPKPPQRKPRFSQKTGVIVEPLINHIDPSIGSDPLEFIIAYWRAEEMATRVTLYTDLRIGGEAAKGPRSFDITPDFDGVGGPATFGDRADPSWLRRAIDNSDLALVPLRSIVRPHIAGTGSGSNERVVSSDSSTLRIRQKFEGVRTVSRTPLEVNRGSAVRTFKGSGLRVIDHYLSFEDKSDDSVLATYCLRIVWHPTMLGADGKRPDRGILYASRITVKQFDWLQDMAVIDDKKWERERQNWDEMLAEDLFQSAGEEAIGDPEESPCATMLLKLDLVTPKILGRITTTMDPKGLAAIALGVVARPLSFDPDRFDKAYDKAVDPVQRLLLATAATAAGSRQRARYLADALVALHSKQPATQRAAFALARELRDIALSDSLISSVKAASESNAALGMFALARNEHPNALGALLEHAGSASSSLVKAAALRALADTGEATARAKLQSANAVGGIDRDSGEFVVYYEGADAGSILESIHELAAAAKAGDAEKAWTLYKAGIANLFARDAAKRALGIGTDEWSTKLTAVVTKLDASKFDGPDDKWLRRICVGSGRAAYAAFVEALTKASGPEKKPLAKLFGATLDTRARDYLKKMSGSDDRETSDAGNAGSLEFQKG